MIWLAVQWVLSRLFDGIPVFHVSETALLYYALGGLLVGGQMLSLGLIAEMLAAEASRDSVGYSITERVDFSAPDEVAPPDVVSAAGEADQA